jgi:hypothetical protein
MSIFRRRRDKGASAARRTEFSPPATVIEHVEPLLNDFSRDDSDVFVCKRQPTAPRDVDATVVTLFVFGWHVVEPGPLSWVFPSLKAALDAVRTMRNAAQWCIAQGNDWPSLDAARAGGAILIEQTV